MTDSAKKGRSTISRGGRRGGHGTGYTNNNGTFWDNRAERQESFELLGADNFG